MPTLEWSRLQVIGVVSERDYLTKVALLGKASKSTPVIQICTSGDANLVTVAEDESVDDCMKKVQLSNDFFVCHTTPVCFLSGWNKSFLEVKLKWFFLIQEDITNSIRRDAQTLPATDLV